MRKLVFLFLSISTLVHAQSTFVHLENAEEFHDLIEYTNVPVVVSFSASWCQPCQHLRHTLIRLGDEYTPNQVILAYVDADENMELRKYVLGGYPTVRSFLGGELLTHFFVGGKSYTGTKSFVERVIARPTTTEHPAYCPLPQSTIPN